MKKPTSKLNNTRKAKPFAPVVHIPVVRTPQPDGSILIRSGKPVVLNGDDEIGTEEASRILGCSVDWVGKLCDRGDLLEGIDWRRIGRRGNYKLKRTSVLKLAGLNPEVAA